MASAMSLESTVNEISRVVSLTYIRSSLYHCIREWSQDWDREWDEFKFNAAAPELVVLLVDYVIDNYRPHRGYDLIPLNALVKCYLPGIHFTVLDKFVSNCTGLVLDLLGIPKQHPVNLYTNREGDILRYCTLME